MQTVCQIDYDGDQAGVVVAARGLLPVALGVNVAVGVVVPGLLGNGSAVYLALVVGAAVVDVLEEWRAMRRLGPLCLVWELQRTAEVEPLLSLLQSRGIEGFARGLSVRSTQQFFAPWIPITVFVPAAHERQAKQLISNRTDPSHP